MLTMDTFLNSSAQHSAFYLLDEEFSYRSSLEFHNYAKKGENDKICEAEPLPSEKHLDKHTCDVCHGTFYLPFFLKSHKCINCEEKTFDCKYCDLKFHHPTGLYSHVRLKHNSLACKVCGTEFPTENALRVHQIVHYTDHRPFKCNECDASFKREAFLGRHKILVHNGGTKCYTCDICQQTFSDVNGLMMHSHPHSRKENLGCHICGKQVTNIPVLTSRMALHGHEHLFYCDTCTKMLIYDIRYSNK